MSVSSMEASMFNTSVAGQEQGHYKTDQMPQQWSQSGYWMQQGMQQVPAQQQQAPIDYKAPLDYGYPQGITPQGYVEQDRMTPEAYLSTGSMSPSLSGESLPQQIPRSIGSISPDHQEFLLATSVPPLGDMYAGDHSGDSDTIVGSGDDDDRANSTSRRRRAQNRVAQRAFRERKQQHVKELEKQLKDTKEKYSSLEKAHNELVTAHEGLKKVVSFLTSKDLAQKVDSVKEVLEILEESQRHAFQE